MTLTRRRFMLQSARVTGGVLATSAAGGGLARAASEPPTQLMVVPPDLSGPSLRNGDYWAFADWLAPLFDQLWDPDRDYYRSGGGSVGRIYHNSALLTTHAIAALTGHDGPSRRDERAARLARQLCDSPPWSERPTPSVSDPQFHEPGWVESMGTTDASMDKSIDPKVAEALMYAWRARGVLSLPEETVHLIEDRITRCARGPFFRFPNVRLNQINWHAEMYAHLATVTGDTELLRDDYRKQVERFVVGITQPLTAGGSPNLGPSYRFHYLPHEPPEHGLNLDSAEYANMTCHFLIWYEHALRAGMAPLDETHVRLLRAWIERIVYGYWTHAGYLNWDTGFSFKRWHVGRTYALARQGLLAIVLSPRFHSRPELGGWSKFMFDGGFKLYARFAREAGDGGGFAPAVLYDLRQNPLGPSVRELFAARMRADAARAVILGLEGIQGVKPPPLYSLDPDVGRLAITTPTYSTAIFAVNQHAIPYGGNELARLFDGQQRVVSNIGGRPWACFGVVIRNDSARSVLVTQRGLVAADPLAPPLALLRSPQGAVRTATPYPTRPYAGPFESLIATGHAGSVEAEVQTTHRFRRDWLETRWKISRRRQGRYTVDITFPSWGRNARVEAVLHDGQRVPLATPTQRRGQVHMRNVRYFYIAGKETGYVLVPVAGHKRGRARIFRPKAQAASPEPGPTLAITPILRSRFKRLEVAVRIAPAASADEAARLAETLRRRKGWR